MDRFIEWWPDAPDVKPNIAGARVKPESGGAYCDFPNALEPNLKQALLRMGITHLFAHQAESYRAITAGENVVIATGTSSGKTLCYNLPVFSRLLGNPKGRALYLFPTKALAYDQLKVLNAFTASVVAQHETGMSAVHPNAAVYDGDTRTDQRSGIRAMNRILVTNPDMLHVGILPHHTLWQELLQNLQYVVIDEIHQYRGVFGSHVANVIRRLKRVAAHYGAFPQFILTSATIANPQAHAQKLIEAPVTLIDTDGSPHSEQSFFLYNPPVIDTRLGIRRSASSEATRISTDLLANHVQSIVFAQTRRSVELLLKSIRERQSLQQAEAVRGYRSGYLPRERREIEEGLKSGDIDLVVSTNALELGVDIGGLDASVLVGYPGSIASVRQQAGRAGRRQGKSLAVLIASGNPIDQYLMSHPDFVFDRSPEQALINPDNLLILLQHLRCAAFELAFRPGERFGNMDEAALRDFLNYLAQAGDLYQNKDQFFWMADRYPASTISLRSASAKTIRLVTDEEGEQQTIGLVDEPSSYWMVHPGAIYLHEGRTFRVDDLDLEDEKAVLTPLNPDYYTMPVNESNVDLISRQKEEPVRGAKKSLGEIKVTTQVTGYKRIDWQTGQILEVEPLQLPSTELRTVAYWLTIQDETLDVLRNQRLWSGDENDYGKDWPRIRELVRNRDHCTCQGCGKVELPGMPQFHVHHKMPLRTFTDLALANNLDNLVTLCPTCHKNAEVSVRIRSGLAGMCYVLTNLAPLFLMCAVGDLGVFADPQLKFEDAKPGVVFYDQVPGGIGLCENLYELHDELIKGARELVGNCNCENGCPSCVGPSGDVNVGGKKETLALLDLLG
ncbi:MAG TPA: DEAD/DEAH box helicase [Longilinea sp.]|nr:DEAD/DEAH box helicase [Longilinea sp.]